MPAKNILRCVCFIAFIILMSSCAASKLDMSLDFNAQPEGFAQPHAGTLGVDEFIDLRQQASTSDAKKWLGFIPGIFWLDFVSEMPDTYTGFSEYKSAPFRMAFAHAIYKNMEQNRLFENTVFLPADKYAPVDFRLEGILNRTFLRETGYYYGSGVYAWVTRIIGLPYVSYEVSIDITLRLRRIATNEVIWTYEMKGDRIDKYYSIYKLAGGENGKHILSYNIAKILEEQMLAVLMSVRKALENH